jgi:hypothetical protein
MKRASLQHNTNNACWSSDSQLLTSQHSSCISGGKEVGTRSVRLSSWCMTSLFVELHVYHKELCEQVNNSQVVWGVLLGYAHLVWLTRQYGKLLAILDTCLDKGDRWYTAIRTHTHAQTSFWSGTMLLAYPALTHRGLWVVKFNAQVLHRYFAKCRHKQVLLCCGIVLNTNSLSASVYCSSFLCFYRQPNLCINNTILMQQYFMTL